MKDSKLKTLYLSGRMAGCTDEEMHGWRNRVKKLYGGPCLDPTDRDYRKVELTMDIVKKIVEDDKKDIRNSDIILVYYESPSVGTSMEIAYAYELESVGNGYKHIVVINENEERLSPWLIYHSDYIFTDMEKAINFIKKL